MSKPVEMKGSNFTLSVLKINTLELEEIKKFIETKVAQAPQFFQDAPVVLDISSLDGEIDFTKLKEIVIDAGLFPVGVSGYNKEQQQAIKAASLAIVTQAVKAKPAREPLKVAIESGQLPTKIVTTPIRSGQQIYAKDADLVILTNVSHGAEVIADGNIHIYGSLFGRAIAGANGKYKGGIYCLDLQAELVSLSGQYWLSENIPSEYWKKPVRFWLDGEQIKIASLNEK